MLSVFLEVILPVAIVAVLGGAVGRWRGVTVPPLSALSFYLFSPALVFDSLSTTQLSLREGASIFAVIVVTTLALLGLSTVWASGRRLDRNARASFVLTVVAPNAGNMGLPVAALAFGQLGQEVGVVHLVGSTLIANTAGIAVASMADGDVRRALRAPFRYPFLYAGVAGVIVRAAEIDLPPVIAAPSASLAGAAIPIMLVVLGLQLKNVASSEGTVELAASAACRLMIAPVVVWFATMLLGLDGTERDVVIVVGAMPTAVFTTIIAAEFRLTSDFVTRAVITSTTASVVTLTGLITLLR